MAYSVPTFNILCNIFTGPAAVPPPRLANVPCNLAAGRRVRDFTGELPDIGQGGGMCLLLGKGTDIRDFASSTGVDYVEVPAGTGRIYYVEWVDDSGRGFPNEYRFAMIYKTVPWPTPIP